MNKPQALQLPAYPPQIMSTGGGDDESLLDIRKIIQALQRRFWLMAVSFLLVFSTVTLISSQQTPIYTAGARVIVNTSETNIVDVETVLSRAAPSTAVIDTEVEVIRSRALLKKVAEKLNLVERPEFNPALVEPSGFDKFKSNVKQFIKGLAPGGDEEAPPEPELSIEEQEAATLDRAVAILTTKVGVGRVGTTYLIDITVRSESPELAADLANAVADQYLVEQLEAKFEAIRRGNEWLDEQLTELREEVNLNERAVEEYRARSGLDRAAGTSVVEQQISDLNAQLIVRETQQSEAQARLENIRRQINRGASLEAIPEVLASELIADLRNQQAILRRERADLQARYGPKFPDVQRVISEEAELSDQIRLEVDRIVASLENEVLTLRAAVDQLKSRLRQLRSELANDNRAQVQLRELERRAEASQTLYQEFLNRFKETSGQEGIAEADARILSTAVAPGGPSHPKTSVNFIIAVFLGGAVAAGLALLAEILDNHFSSAEDVERLFGTTAIGSIPYLSGLRGFSKQAKAPADHLLENPLSAFAESIRNLRASIIFADLDRAAKTVAVSSSLPDEGKTSLTYCLGRMSAISGARTIVIDGDFRRRQLTETVLNNQEPSTGFIEHLFGEVSLEEAIYVDPQTGMHMLPLTDSKNTPRDVFGSRTFDTLLAELKNDYDLVVIDTGPILLMAESRVVASKTDQVIVAARWRSTSRKALSETLSILREFNASIAGVVLTFVDMSRRSRFSSSNVNYRSYRKYYMSD